MDVNETENNGVGDGDACVAPPADDTVPPVAKRARVSEIITDEERTLRGILSRADEEGAVDWDAFLQRLSSHPHEALREIRPRKGGRDGPIRWVLEKRPPLKVVELLLEMHGEVITGTYSRPEGHSALVQALACDASGEYIRLICQAKPEAVQKVRFCEDEEDEDDQLTLLPIHEARCVDHIKVLQKFYPEGIAVDYNNGTALARRVKTVLTSFSATPLDLDLIRACLEEGMLLRARKGDGDLSGGAMLCSHEEGYSLMTLCMKSIVWAEHAEARGGSLVECDAIWSVLELLVQAVSCAMRGGFLRLFKKLAGDQSDFEDRVLQQEVFDEVFSDDFLFLKAHIQFVDGGSCWMEHAIEHYHSQINIPDKDGNLPLGIAAMRKRHSLDISRLVFVAPKAASVPNKKGRLALHLAAESGLSGAGLVLIVQAHPEALATQDVTTGLYPFMIAAMENHVDVAFSLLLEKPDLVNTGTGNGEIKCGVAMCVNE